jgi:DNA-binding transcriptional MerR regulator
MMKLSEVCRLVGITRRTLQEYNRIDLVCPTGKTEGGYWLYDEEAVAKLIQIQIFVEAEYERKAIKKLLESPKLDLVKEYDQLIERLSVKKKRIDGMINSIKIIRLSAL